MATTRVVLLLVVHLFCLTEAGRGNYFRPLLQPFSTTLKSCNFGQIYQLGDSLSDTGNILLETPVGSLPFGSFPYGENFYANATGRCSDGMLMIDYIALASGLPLLNPYKKVDADFRHGVNFAVAGATALPIKALADWNIPSEMTNSSLDVQLNWMSSYFSSICKTNRDCAKKHRSSLFVVGEIGGNDINYALSNGKTIDEIRSMMPVIIQAIKDAVQAVINYGAFRIIVPGNFPMGCLPATLTLFETNDLSAYDEHNCLTEVNKLTMYENELIQLAIKELKEQNPSVTIVYGDYYNAFQWINREAEYLGLDIKSLQKCCCGAGGEYNFGVKFCGDPDVSVCEDPSRFIMWDGVHLTQEAYKLMTSWIIKDIFPQLQCIHSSSY